MSTPSPGPTEQSAEAPHCYRHPDRETYVRCVRCDRPICPDCMRSASVGFQCPECVHEGRQTTRPARTTFGGLVPSNVGAVSRLIIGICVVVFIFQQSSNTFTTKYELIPRIAPRFRPDLVLGGVADGEYYRLITSAFLHVNVLHIFFNMYALLIVGPPLEAVLGRARFVALYLLSALGGSALAYVLMPPDSAAVGASGAIFGLFGALFIVSRRLGRDASGILTLIAINLVFTFTFSGIAWQAHVGGLVAGSALSAAYAYAPRDKQVPVQVAATVAVAGAIVIAVLARTAALT